MSGEDLLAHFRQIYQTPEGAGPALPPPIDDVADLDRYFDLKHFGPMGVRVLRLPLEDQPASRRRNLLAIAAAERIAQREVSTVTDAWEARPR